MPTCLSISLEVEVTCLINTILVWAQKKLIITTENCEWDVKCAKKSEEVLRCGAQGYRWHGCFTEKQQEMELMWCITIRNTPAPITSHSSSTNSPMTLSTSILLFLSVSLGLTSLHFMAVFFLYLLDKTMDNNPGIAQRRANESNQAVLSWWRSGSLIKP